MSPQSVTLSRRSLFQWGAAGLAVPAAAGLIAPASTQAAEDPALLNGAGFYRFKIGGLDAMAISDGTFGGEDLPHPTFGFNASLDSFTDVVEAAYLPTERWSIAVNTLLVETGGQRVLIDAGTGDKWAPGAAGRQFATLARAGIDPASIDVVIVTHAHPDHLWGVTNADGTVLYPNAEVKIGAADIDFWGGDGADLSKSPLPDDIKNTLIGVTRDHIAALGDRISAYGDGDTLAPGITAVAAPGHTPGHAAIMIEDGDHSLLNLADTGHFFATALARPDWKVAFDTDPDTAVITRTKMFDRVATDRQRVMVYHFPWPGIGHIVPNGAGGFAWVPEPVVL